MIEAILLGIAYCTTVIAGMVTNYLPNFQKTLAVIFIGIGGLIVCVSLNQPYCWVVWVSWISGFMMIAVFGKRKPIEVFTDSNVKYHITQDASGKVKVRNFKIYNGGKV
jgi:hypothetical protein